jgi:hypothetical protein
MKKLLSMMLVIMTFTLGCAFAETAGLPDDKLTENPLDGGLVIDGVFYQLPFVASELLENGWIMECEDEPIESGIVLSMITCYKDNLTLDMRVINEYAETKNISECHVCTIQVGPASFGNGYNTVYDLIDVKFSQNVDINTSEDELIAIMGEPTSTAGGYPVWRGTNGKYLNPGHSFSRVADPETGDLRYFNIEYVPADFVAE